MTKYRIGLCIHKYTLLYTMVFVIPLLRTLKRITFVSQIVAPFHFLVPSGLTSRALDLALISYHF